MPDPILQALETHAQSDKDHFERQEKSNERQDQALILVHSKLDRLVGDHPTNGELGIMIAGIARDVNEVKIQTTKTNGRVTVLEADQNKSEGHSDGTKALWGWIVAGITIIITVANFVLPHLK